MAITITISIIITLTASMSQHVAAISYFTEPNKPTEGSKVLVTVKDLDGNRKYLLKLCIMCMHINERTLRFLVIFGNSIFSEHHLLWKKMPTSCNIKLVEIKGCFLDPQKLSIYFSLVVYLLNISVSLSLFCLSESDINIVL